MSIIDEILLSILACPRDHSDLVCEDNQLCCAHGHRYPVVDGIPVFILREQSQTIGIASASLEAANTGIGGPVFAATLGLTDEQRAAVERLWNQNGGGSSDPAISYLIGATSGFGYLDLIGKLGEYPIPDIPIGSGKGELLLDVGCNWGRWVVSAQRKQWSAVGIDPSLGALAAAKRAFPDLQGRLVCGDARYLPFKDDTFRLVFSYSVIQHFSHENAKCAVSEMARVLAKGGLAKVQLAHRYGLRSIYHVMRSQLKEQGVFRVRYWTIAQMKAVFSSLVGPTSVKAEAFGGLGILAEDYRFVSRKAQLLTVASGALKRASKVLPLRYVADSLYVEATKSDRLHDD